MSWFDVAVVGAGPAGAFAAYLLAKRGRTVALLERNPLDAHLESARPPLCGEFLSPDLLERLARHELGSVVASAGGCPIHEVNFCSPSRSVRLTLPASGLGLSRRALDAALRRAAVGAGAALRRPCRISRFRRGTGGFELDLPDATLLARHLLLATGKHPAPSIAVAPARDTSASHGDWLAARIHVAPSTANKSTIGGEESAACTPEAAPLRLFFFEGGYIGLGPIEGGVRNLCGLFRRSIARAAFEGGRLSMGWCADRLPAIAMELRDAVVLDEGSAAVSGLHFGAIVDAPASNGAWRIGDAAGMIAPLAGSGLAMALESAELASDHLIRSRPDGAAFARDWNRRFGARIRVSVALQNLLLHRASRDLLLRVIHAVPRVGRFALRRTRGAFRAEPGSVS